MPGAGGWEPPPRPERTSLATSGHRMASAMMAQQIQATGPPTRPLIVAVRELERPPQVQLGDRGRG